MYRSTIIACIWLINLDIDIYIIDMNYYIGVKEFCSYFNFLLRINIPMCKGFKFFYKKIL